MNPAIPRFQRRIVVMARTSFALTPGANWAGRRPPGRCTYLGVIERRCRDDANRRLVPQSEVTRLAKNPQQLRTEDTSSARNRFPGLIRSVEELGLAPGVPAVATVKATSVMVVASSQDGRLQAPQGGCRLLRWRV